MNMESARAGQDRIWTEQLRDGLVIRIRPLREDDALRERTFLARLSQDARAERFVGLVRAIDDDVVHDLTCVDPACAATLGAFAPSEGGEIEIAAAAYVVRPDSSECDCTVTVDPYWQKLGVGRALMRHLIDIARERGIRRMYAADTDRHGEVHALGDFLGFHSRPDPDDPLVTTRELVIR